MEERRAERHRLNHHHLISPVEPETGIEPEKPISNPYHSMSISDAIKHMDAGEFPEGSMGPKVESLIEAAQKVDAIKSVLCQPGDAIKALRGETGTTLVV